MCLAKFFKAGGESKAKIKKLFTMDIRVENVNQSLKFEKMKARKEGKL